MELQPETAASDQKIIPVFTTRNASKFSAYDIRQELNRRGAFDFKDGDEVNFRTMLQRLMVELVREEDEASQQRGQQKQAAVLSAVEEAKRLRELKKQEALERSRQRQANPAYFQQRADLNVPPPKALVAADEVEEDSEEHTSDDPFRSYKSSARPKVFVL